MLERPSFEELLPTKELQQAFDDKTAAFEAGRLINHMRRSANLTQVQLAARLGVTQARVSTIESGEGIDGPTFGLLKRIVLACEFQWDPHFATATRADAAHETGPKRRATAAGTAAKPKARSNTFAGSSMIPSKELAAVIGPDPLSRTEVVSKVWDYIKAHKLQNEANRREIIADDKLKAVFGKDKVTIFEMNKHVSAHMIGWRTDAQIRPQTHVRKTSAASE